MLTLVTGGARSGKSRRALELARPLSPRAFIATAQAFDDEMSDRITRHRRDRGDTFLTIEEPYDLAAALRRVPAGIEVVLLDCLTVWLGNVMHRAGTTAADYVEVESFITALGEPWPFDLIIVTNEVGSGIVPESPLSRRYRDLAGEINQRVAQLADEVVLVVSGLPLTLKQAAAGREPRS